MSKITLLFFIIMVILAGCGGEDSHYNSEAQPLGSAVISAQENGVTGLPIKVSWTLSNIDWCTIKSDSSEAKLDVTVRESGSTLVNALKTAGTVNFQLYCEQKAGESANIFKKSAKTVVAAESSTSSRITNKGGTIDLDGFAGVRFPENSLNSQDVLVSKIESNDNTALFNETAKPFITEFKTSLPYQIRIEVNGMRPRLPTNIRLFVPTSYLKNIAINSSTELAIFYNSFEVSELSRLLIVDSLKYRFRPDSSFVDIELPPEAFSDDYTFNSGRYVAVLYLVYSDSHPQNAPFNSQLQSIGMSSIDSLAQLGTLFNTTSPTSIDTEAECSGGRILPPVEGGVTSSPFGLREHPITHQTTFHKGTDFHVPTGTEVKAVGNGIVEKVGFQFNASIGTGWGHYMVLRHSDNSKTLYAHLKEGTLISQGTSVHAGDPIALSNASGGVTGPHLHVEYSPNGKLYGAGANRTNIESCINASMLEASLYAYDDGTQSDDAFEISLDGYKVCQTDIGLGATCLLADIRAGLHNLEVKCVAAPDNKCTLGISLFNKMRFSDGTDSKSITTMLNQVISLPVSI